MLQAVDFGQRVEDAWSSGAAFGPGRTNGGGQRGDGDGSTAARYPAAGATVVQGQYGRDYPQR